MKTLLLAGALCLGSAVTAVQVRQAMASSRSHDIRINEVLADNEGTIADENGDFDDYIELYNRCDAPVDLGGMYLSDDSDDPTRFRLPEGTRLAPGECLLVWADGEPDEGPLHAPFKVSSKGEEIALYDSEQNGHRILDRVAFGPQEPDVAFGAGVPGSSARGSIRPTPGRAR